MYFNNCANSKLTECEVVINRLCSSNPSTYLELPGSVWTLHSVGFIRQIKLETPLACLAQMLNS